MSRESLISIITVVKNAENTIEKCIKSILNQNYKNVQYIIIDGNSTDNTKKIIEKYRNKVSLIISEDDNGIWDAMNKGIKLAEGEILGFINADDFYYENSLKIVNKYFSEENIDFLFGTVKKYKLMHGYNPSIIKWSFGFYTSHSVGFFIKTQKHKEVGFYNTKYLSADLDFFYKMIVNFKLKGKSTKKEEILGEFGKGGFSSKINYLQHLKDLNQIRIDNKQNKHFVYFLYFVKIIKKPLKFISSILSK
tara:strand:- start:2098 stop:2847 length:750 start_codon:yes stop_codon:yes gene_type:complete